MNAEVASLILRAYMFGAVAWFCVTQAETLSHISLRVSPWIADTEALLTAWDSDARAAVAGLDPALVALAATAYMFICDAATIVFLVLNAFMEQSSLLSFVAMVMLAFGRFAFGPDDVSVAFTLGRGTVFSDSFGSSPLYLVLHICLMSRVTSLTRTGTLVHASVALTLFCISGASTGVLLTVLGVPLLCLSTRRETMEEEEEEEEYVMTTASVAAASVVVQEDMLVFSKS
jgi:hypothetical protein